jgi:hypothetical protein
MPSTIVEISPGKVSEPPVTNIELNAWYSFGFALEGINWLNPGYSALGISAYFPILMEGLSASGFLTIKTSCG